MPRTLQYIKYITVDIQLPVRDSTNYNAGFFLYPPQNLANLLPQLDPVGLNLLQEMLQLQPDLRISARDALQHQWFADYQTY